MSHPSSGTVTPLPGTYAVGYGYPPNVSLSSFSQLSPPHSSTPPQLPHSPQPLPQSPLQHQTYIPCQSPYGDPMPHPATYQPHSVGPHYPPPQGELFIAAVRGSDPHSTAAAAATAAELAVREAERSAQAQQAMNHLGYVHVDQHAQSMGSPSKAFIAQQPQSPHNTTLQQQSSPKPSNQPQSPLYVAMHNASPLTQPEPPLHSANSGQNSSQDSPQQRLVSFAHEGVPFQLGPPSKVAIPINTHGKVFRRRGRGDTNSIWALYPDSTKVNYKAAVGAEVGGDGSKRYAEGWTDANLLDEDTTAGCCC
eukprot:GHVN01009242.1.p1 GENE.GHVN01009242.1~~GHVN01009242.1.p1  ORF type:complete len:308 (+),score=85.54 GHVN01009242.1:378-1301(+)